MAWPLMLGLILGSFLLLMATGMPVAFSFVLVNLIGVFVFFGGAVGVEQLVLSMFTSLSTFTLVAIPLFILMGEVMFQSGLARTMIDTLDKWLGRLPGRLALLTVAAGTVLSTLTGTSIASTALLGATLVPEAEKRGYKTPMSLGPALGSGGLAIMIPPSSLAVLLGAIGEISISRILIGIIVPGILMAAIFATYIILRCSLQRSIAPAYEVPTLPLLEKIIPALQYILPLGFVIFLVTGVIFIGVATASEAAATGAIGSIILVACYGRLTWDVVKKTINRTVRTTVMMFMIIAGAKTFGEILAFTGAVKGLGEFTVGLPLAPILILIAMQIVLLFLGMFMSVIAIMMITLPIFVPIVVTLGFDTVWFAVIYLLNMEIATISPPFGLSLFALKGVSPPYVTMGNIYKASLPFVYCDLIALGFILVFPPIALWLPGLMRG